MSAFKKGEWLTQFATDSGADARVSAALRAHGKPRRSRGIRTPMLPPIIEVKSLSDLPDDLTVAEVAKKLRTSPDVVYERIRSGRLFAQKEGSEWRIPLWSLARYLAERPANVA